MYADVKGLVTVAIGNLIDPIQVSLPLPFRHADGTFATRNEIAAEWARVKNDPKCATLGWRYAKTITSLHLDTAGIDLVVSRKLSQMDAYLAVRFPDYEDWPACAQLATLSMSWACGPAFHFPALDAALKARDFAAGATHCTINEAGNPGVIPRNGANRILYLNAQRVDSFRLDPSLLEWQVILGVHDLDTVPAMDVAPDSEPTTTATFPTIHPLRYDRGPDDPPDEAAQ